MKKIWKFKKLGITGYKENILLISNFRLLEKKNINSDSVLMYKDKLISIDFDKKFH